MVVMVLIIVPIPPFPTNQRQVYGIQLASCPLLSLQAFGGSEPRIAGSKICRVPSCVSRVLEP